MKRRILVIASIAVLVVAATVLGGVSLAAGGSNDLIVDGAIAGGANGISLTAGGAIAAGAGSQVAADSLTISAASVARFLP